MASSSIRLTGSDLEKHAYQTFETVIDCNEKKIRLPESFCKYWGSELKKEGLSWVVYGDCHFKLHYQESESNHYLTPGNKLAQVLMLSEPTTIKLKYDMSENTFNCKILGTVVFDQTHEQQSPSPVNAAPVAMLGKGKEKMEFSGEVEKPTGCTGSSTMLNSQVPIKAAVTPGHVKRGQHDAVKYFFGNLDGINGWRTTVTAAAASKYNTQVLHFPKKITNAGLLRRQKTILVKTNQNVGWTRCKIKTAKRDKYDKFISKDWATILKTNDIREGDVLVFMLLQRTTKMFIHIFHP